MSVDSKEIGFVFSSKYPKAVDFSQSEYEANTEEMTRIATEAGYKFVGFRLQRAVFSTK